MTLRCRDSKGHLYLLSLVEFVVVGGQGEDGVVMVRLQQWLPVTAVIDLNVPEKVGKNTFKSIL